MEQVISSDGTTISFRRSGSGRPLLLVHGTTADHTRWSAISASFEQHFTVYAMDRRGRGASDDAADYHVLREAEDVAAVIEAIGEPVYVLGHSFGGLCSLEAALLSDKIDRLIIYELPIPSLPSSVAPETPERMQALVDRGELEAALETFFRNVVGMPEHELAIYRRLPMWQRRIKLAPTIPRELGSYRTYRFDAQKFADLQLPVMLLVGGDSPPFFRDAIESVHAVLPDSRVVELAGQRHVAMDTAPELFVDTVLSFLLP